jgi:predicted molibdopterin-dependent oxidoreductase YjgC
MADAQKTCEICIDDQRVHVPVGTTVAAAIARTGERHFRTSRSGMPRAPLCGMGSCFECRVTIDGHAHRLSCQTICVDGMAVQTDG